MLNRTIQPEIKRVSNIRIINPEIFSLSNGIPVYSFNIGDEEVLKVRLMFNAGSWYQSKKLTARYAAEILSEGTKVHSGTQIAEMLDTYGAFMDTSADSDYSHTCIYLLNKHAKNVLPLAAEVIRDPVFPEEEMVTVLANGRQSLTVTMRKVDYLAGIHFKELLYGSTHPYGMWAKPEDYDVLSRNDIVSFYNQHYNPLSCRITVSGKVTDEVLQLLENNFGNWKPYATGISEEHSPDTSEEKSRIIPVDNALQSSIRIGRVLFGRKHPDFFPMICLNTMLGGYFGSRLMKNIREDKGYTYGIGSGLVAFKNSGFISVYSEVKAEVREKVVEEIYKEIATLRSLPVTEDELETVKNYMLGSFLRSIDGPFATEERFIGMIETGIDFKEYMNNYIHVINTVTSEDLMNLAIKYLDPESFTEVFAGR